MQSQGTSTGFCIYNVLSIAGGHTCSYIKLSYSPFTDITVETVKSTRQLCATGKAIDVPLLVNTDRA
jgi:hypothetical protein